MQKKSRKKLSTARKPRRTASSRAEGVCPESGVREKNMDLIREEFVAEVDTGLEFIEKKLSRLYKGALGFLANQVVGLLYKYLGMHEARKKGIERMDFFINSLRNFDGDVNALVDSSLDGFLHCNEAWLRRNPGHPAIPEFKRNLREEYRSQVEIYAKMMDVKGDTYGELVRMAYPKRDVLDKLLDKQFKIIDRQMQLVEREAALIRIPRMIRKEVLSLTKLGYDYTQKRIKLRLDEIYELEGQPICAGAGFGRRSGMGGESVCWRRGASSFRV